MIGSQTSGLRFLYSNGNRDTKEITMFRGLLLWMAGVPIAGIIVLSLLGFLR